MAKEAICFLEVWLGKKRGDGCVVSVQSAPALESFFKKKKSM